MGNCRPSNKRGNVSVVSVYLGNISGDIVDYQRLCVERFLPPNCSFQQIFRDLPAGEASSHAQALNDFLTVHLAEVIVILDIDCIPLSPRAFPRLIECCRDGTLVGGVQRANHLDNDRHLYVGPFCMAFSLSAYKELGSPSFSATSRGDVGEEVTYRWEEERKAVHFLWPSACDKPIHPLDFGFNFGIGTTYEDLFYHSGYIRVTRLQLEDTFIEKCRKVLSTQSFS